MGSWRDQILKEFTPRVARLTLVADPDGLLLEEKILEGIRERGFEMIPFEDHVEFRYAFESKFRSYWDKGEETDLVVVLRSSSSDLDTLPYDLLQVGRKLSFNLGDLFPNLSYPVVAALDRADLDVLFEVQEKYAPGQLGDNATKDFILRHVFEIAPELIKQPSDLLRVLLRRHYRGRRLPAILDERLIHVLRQNSLFEDWPLETIIPDREAFFAFLQERWSVFLDWLVQQKGGSIHDKTENYGLKFSGPLLLPFDHNDVRIYIDNLFLEGFLKPVHHEHIEELANTWVGYGIKVSPIENRIRRIEGLLNSVAKTIPSIDARYWEWFNFAYRWSELITLTLEANASLPEKYLKRIKEFRDSIDSALIRWVLKRYASLINLPPIPPVMLHHIPRYLARSIENEQCVKMALLLLDGLSIDQWIAIREVLKGLEPSLCLREDAVFAWVPTITPVSRQAVFAGKPPIYFPTSIHTTDKESALWTQFWIDQGLRGQEVAYLNVLGDKNNTKLIVENIVNPKLRVFGIVIRKIDRIMHGMELGSAGMHNQVRQWVKQGFLLKLIALLHSSGFQVYLTSDHGNIQAHGMGRPAEGAIAELKGERVRVYSDARLRSQIKKQFPESFEWPSIGLPDDYLVLIASNRNAFVKAGETLIAHGGISVEELIVPFIQIKREN